MEETGAIMTKAQYLKKLSPYGGNCRDCGGKNHPYMLTFKLWSKLVPEAKGNESVWKRDESGKLIEVRPGFFVCLKCIEIRLGRNLMEKDFLDAPINYEGIRGFDCELFVTLK